MKKADVSSSQSLSSSSIRRKWLYNGPLIWILFFLGGQNKSATLEKEREITGEIKAARDPAALGNGQFRPAFLAEPPHVLNRLPKRFRVGSPPVPYSSEIRYRHHNLRLRRMSPEEGGAGGVLEIGGESGRKPYGGERGSGGDLEGENSEEDEEEEKGGTGGIDGRAEIEF